MMFCLGGSQLWKVSTKAYCQYAFVDTFHSYVMRDGCFCFCFAMREDELLRIEETVGGIGISLDLPSIYPPGNHGNRSAG